MAVTLFDASVARFIQILDATGGVLDKGRAHIVDQGGSLDAVVETSLFDDMLPFRFQLASVAHHSLGAIQGVEAGEFRPPSTSPDQDYDTLAGLVAAAREGLAQYTPDSVNALEGRTLEFKLGDNSLPFKAENFLLSFSIPNFFFHATTAYDILRREGVPLGKRDFLGQLLVG